jgi:hypothetical protein
MRPAAVIARIAKTAPVVAAACALIAASPADAKKLRMLPLQPSAAATSATAHLFPTKLRDDLRATAPRSFKARRGRAGAAKAVFRTGDGISIPVEVSASYAPNPAVEQGYVSFLGGLVHGSELANLSVFIAPPRQIQSTYCGAGALACYIGDEQRMYVPGVTQHADPPVQFLIAHEYGHHIELHRSDDPWSAYDHGAKYWASHENVCALERRRRVTTNYYNDASEAFAESYADMQFPGVDFIYTDLLAPDDAAFKAIRTDVLRPWRGPHTVSFRGSFAPGARATQTFRLQTPLDGNARFELSAPQDAAYSLRVVAGSRVVARTRADAVGYTVCGARSLTVQVTRSAGSGPFTVAANVP